MISYAFVDGFTRAPRDEAIERLKRAIAQADGVIVDFAYFGSERSRGHVDHYDAIRLTVELDAAAFGELRNALTDAEVELFPGCLADLDAAKAMDPTHPIVAMLHVAFVPAESELIVAAHPH